MGIVIIERLRLRAIGICSRVLINAEGSVVPMSRKSLKATPEMSPTVIAVVLAVTVVLIALVVWKLSVPSQVVLPKHFK